jgi:hypothetical protein
MFPSVFGRVVMAHFDGSFEFSGIAFNSQFKDIVRIACLLDLGMSGMRIRRAGDAHLLHICVFIV